MTARFHVLYVFTVCCALLMLSGCAETQLFSHYAKKLPWPGEEQSAGTYKVGKPYKVGSVWYYPQEDFKMVETGIASWYGPDFHGKRTANGEIYDQNELTGAHRTLQMPSLVRVTNLENGRSIVIRINDRGPYLHGRVVDVSKRSAELLGFIGKGTARVKLQVLEKESRQIASAARKGLDTSRLTLADLNKIDTSAPVTTAATETYPEPIVKRGPQVASRASYTDSSLPESLQTPTITVEELSAPANGRTATYNKPQKSYTPPPREEERKPVASYGDPVLSDISRRPPSASSDEFVTTEPVTPTGIFVQAGSFAVQENATRLKDRLSSIAPVMIEPITVKGRKLYRVKLGPIGTVEKADRVLESVIAAGNDTARVIRN